MVSGFHLSCRDEFFVINHILFNVYSNLKSADFSYIRINRRLLRIDFTNTEAILANYIK